MTGLNFNGAHGRQRKALRVAITSAFNKRTLRRFLDEELELNLDNLVREDDFPNEVWELIQKLRARGLIDAFMQKWIASDEFGGAPVLSDLRQNWPMLSDDGGRIGKPGVTVAEPAETSTLPPLEPPAGAKSALPEVPAETSDNRQKGDLESILDDNVNRMSGVAWLKGVAALSRQICMVRSGQGPIGTGFLVGPRLVMTAAHVARYLFEGPEPFEVVFDQVGGTDQAKIVRVANVIAADPNDLGRGDGEQTDWYQFLDFALLKLSEEVPPVDGGPRGWIDLTDHRSRLYPGEAVATLYYPRAPRLVIAQGSVANRPALSGRFGYDANTVPGASGAPVLDARLKLIGFHEGRKVRTEGNEAGSYAVRADAIAREFEARGIKLPKPPTED